MGAGILRLAHSRDICQKQRTRDAILPHLYCYFLWFLSCSLESLSILVVPLHLALTEKYIHTIVDFAMKWQEAVVLKKNIEATMVAEALLDVFCRSGVPKEDWATEARSLHQVEETWKLLSVKGIKATPYSRKEMDFVSNLIEHWIHYGRPASKMSLGTVAVCLQSSLRFSLFWVGVR